MTQKLLIPSSLPIKIRRSVYERIQANGNFGLGPTTLLRCFGRYRREELESWLDILVEESLVDARMVPLRPGSKKVVLVYFAVPEEDD